MSVRWNRHTEESKEMLAKTINFLSGVDTFPWHGHHGSIFNWSRAVDELQNIWKELSEGETLNPFKYRDSSWTLEKCADGIDQFLWESTESGQNYWENIHDYLASGGEAVPRRRASTRSRGNTVGEEWLL